MPAIAERLTEQQLNAMRDRASHLLAPEGAQSWHQLDVTALLNEVNVLQNSLDAARQEFKDDGVEADDLPLFVVAQRWKQNATGIYEKAIVKKLQAHVRELTAARDEALKELRNRDELRLKAEKTNVERYAEIQRLDGLLEAAREQYDTQLQAEQAELITAREEINKLNDALVDCVHRCESVLQMQKAQTDAQRAEVREALVRALEVLDARP